MVRFLVTVQPVYVVYGCMATMIVGYILSRRYLIPILSSEWAADDIPVWIFHTLSMVNL